MEQTEEKVASETCSKCSETLELTSVFCGHCGYPENGSEKDVLKYKRHLIIWTNQLEGAKKKVKNARITLFILAGICILIGAGFALFSDNDEMLIIGITNIIIGTIYGGLGMWSQEKPVGAIVTALIIYGTIILLSALADPATLMHGIILKVLVIAALVKGLMSASEGKQIMDELPPYLRKWN